MGHLKRLTAEARAGSSESRRASDNTMQQASKMTSRSSRLSVSGPSRGAKKAIEVMNKDKAVKQGIFEEVLRLRDVESWPTWEKEASTFPWTYEENEEAYIIEGECTVTPS